MASKLKKTPLKVSVVETYSLNGRKNAVESTAIYDDIRETSSRIVSVTNSGDLAGGVQVFTTDATNPGPAQFVLADVRYVRITNLDDKNTITIRQVTDGITINHPLPASGSILVGSLTLSTTFTVIGHASDSVDVEIFVASV